MKLNLPLWAQIGANQRPRYLSAEHSTADTSIRPPAQMKHECSKNRKEKINTQRKDRHKR